MFTVTFFGSIGTTVATFPTADEANAYAAKWARCHERYEVRCAPGRDLFDAILRSAS